MVASDGACQGLVEILLKIVKKCSIVYGLPQSENDGPKNQSLRDVMSAYLMVADIAKDDQGSPAKTLMTLLLEINR